jgi:hypothetical protein
MPGPFAVRSFATDAHPLIDAAIRCSPNLESKKIKSLILIPFGLARTIRAPDLPSHSTEPSAEPGLIEQDPIPVGFGRLAGSRMSGEIDPGHARSTASRVMLEVRLGKHAG